MLPDSDDLNRMIDKDKFYFLSKKKVFSEKFKKPLDFFLNLKSIGANINLKKTKINLFFLRRMTSEIKINYHISFFFIKKIKE